MQILFPNQIPHGSVHIVEPNHNVHQSGVGSCKQCELFILSSVVSSTSSMTRIKTEEDVRASHPS